MLKLHPETVGTVAVGSAGNLTFTIRNVGSADLEGLGLTPTGPDADRVNMVPDWDEGFFDAGSGQETPTPKEMTIN